MKKRMKKEEEERLKEGMVGRIWLVVVVGPILGAVTGTERTSDHRPWSSSAAARGGYGCGCLSPPRRDPRLGGDKSRSLRALQQQP